MKEDFKLSVFHPDEAKSYIFDSYIELKHWREDDGYRYPVEDGGCCYYTYHNEYTKRRLEEAKERYERYWQNKVIENQRSKIWREKQKLNKLLKASSIRQLNIYDY